MAGDDHKDIHVLKPELPLALPGETQPGLDELSRKLYDSASPAVVQIIVNGKAINHRDQRGTGVGKGSGFYVDDKGTVVTDAHVVLGGHEIFVLQKDGKQYKAQVEKLDDINDLAVLKTVGQTVSTPFLQMGQSTGMKEDTKVWAVGHPQGLRPSYISPGYFRFTSDKLTELTNINAAETHEFIEETAFNRTAAELSDFQKSLKGPLIHGRVHIEQGNSGGPLIDKDGLVVGISDQVVRNDYSQSYYNRVEDLKNLMENKDQKFKFSYAYEPSAWAQQHLIDWHTHKGSAIGTLGVAAGAGFLGYRAINRYPKLGLAAGLIGAMSAVDDTSDYLNSTNSRDSWKYGLATLSDLTTVGGAIATAIPKAKTLGLVALGIGVVGRLATDFIPNHLMMTDIERTDGSYRPPFNVERELDIRR